MVRLAGPLLLAVASATLTAPLQCARNPGAELRAEDDAAEVLYTLAERFKAQGNAPARAETLRFLVSRYPESRFAQAARLDLEGAPGANRTNVTSEGHSPPSPSNGRRVGLRCPRCSERLPFPPVVRIEASCPVSMGAGGPATLAAARVYDGGLVGARRCRS